MIISIMILVVSVFHYILSNK